MIRGERGNGRGKGQVRLFTLSKAGLSSSKWLYAADKHHQCRLYSIELRCKENLTTGVDVARGDVMAAILSLSHRHIPRVISNSNSAAA